MNAQSEARPSLAQLLALNRTVAVVLLAVLFFGLGEQLWEPFMSVYLAAKVKLMKKAATVTGSVGAEVLWLVGAYAFLRNLFEGFCYIGGGQLTARLGDRGSLLLFGLLTVAGYALFLAWQAPAATVVAALLILGWEPLSVPVTFTTVGSTVGLSGRGMAFALQSIQKRLPKMLGPLLAGFVLYRAELLLGSKEAGRVAGMRWLVGLSLALGVVSLLIQVRWMPHHKPAPRGPSSREVLRRMHPTLRRLLLAEVFKRWCDWMVREFAVLYVVVVRGVSVEAAGVFLAVQHLTALLTYLPVGRLTRTVGLQPFIGVTFVFFALFPLTLALLPGGWWLALAFVVNGLRETGEPARKALITSLLPAEVRARGVGLYWGLRSFAICPASLAGAAVWYWLGPQALLCAAFALGGVGAALYYLLCRGPVLWPEKGGGP
jgi:MFS family permease